MLRINEVIIEVLRLLRPVIRAIEKHDRDLARQLKAASSSILLNSCEASGSRAGTRTERHHNAFGSACESTGCVYAAIAHGYVESVDPVLLDKLDHVRATFYKLTH
jgi:four helix bundle protein